MIQYSIKLICLQPELSKNCWKIFFLEFLPLSLTFFIKFCTLMQNNRDRPFWHFLQISSYSFLWLFAQRCELAIFKIWRIVRFFRKFLFWPKMTEIIVFAAFHGTLFVCFLTQNIVHSHSNIFLKSPEQPITAGFLEFMFVLKSFIHDLLFHSFVCSFVRLFLFQAPFH